MRLLTKCIDGCGRLAADVPPAAHTPLAVVAVVGSSDGLLGFGEAGHVYHRAK